MILRFSQCINSVIVLFYRTLILTSCQYWKGVLMLLTKRRVLKVALVKTHKWGWPFLFSNIKSILHSKTPNLFYLQHCFNSISWTEGMFLMLQIFLCLLQRQENTVFRSSSFHIKQTPKGKMHQFWACIFHELPPKRTNILLFEVHICFMFWADRQAKRRENFIFIHFYSKCRNIKKLD